MSLDDPDALALEYSRTMMAVLLWKPAPQRIVMVGLGGGSLVKFCHRHLPATRIEVVEINPKVLALREAFRIPPDGPRLQVRLGDGAQYLREAEAGCDVLMVDGFDYDGQPPDLCSQAFYDDCAAFLAADGILAVNLYRRHPEFAVFVDRLRVSFDDQVLVINGRTDPGNAVVLAFRTPRVPVQRMNLVRAPRSLDEAAAQQLAASFEMTLDALKAAQR